MTEQPPAPPPGSEPPTSGSVPPAVPAATTTASGQPLAEWYKRLIASVIDGFIIGIPANIIGGVIFGSLFSASTPTFNPQTGQIEGAGFLAGILASYGAFLLAYLAFTAAYYIYLHSKKGQTVGKMVMKIKVVDETTGDLIPMGKAAVRWVVPQALFFLTCGIGGLLDGLWPLWDPKRQAIHDKVAGTQVIDVA